MIKKYDCESCRYYCKEDKSCTACPPYKSSNLNCGGISYEAKLKQKIIFMRLEDGQKYKNSSFEEVGNMLV